MPHLAALPFKLKRGNDVLSNTGYTATRETVHGLLRLEDERLVIQWRVARKTEHVGEEIRSDKEVEPVREIIVPLRGVAGAVLRRADRLAAEEFVAELALTLAELAHLDAAATLPPHADASGEPEARPTEVTDGTRKG